jgi:hypothetical protein
MTKKSDKVSSTDSVHGHILKGGVLPNFVQLRGCLKLYVREQRQWPPGKKSELCESNPCLRAPKHTVNH